MATHFTNAAGQTVAKDPRGAWRVYNPQTQQFGPFAKAPPATPTPTATPAPTPRAHWAVSVAALVALIVGASIFSSHVLENKKLDMVALRPPAVTAPDKAPPAKAESAQHRDKRSPFVDAAPRGHRFVGATRGTDGASCETRGGHIVPDTSAPLVKTYRGWARPNRCTAD